MVGLVAPEVLVVLAVTEALEPYHLAIALVLGVSVVMGVQWAVVMGTCSLPDLVRAVAVAVRAHVIPAVLQVAHPAVLVEIPAVDRAVKIRLEAPLIHMVRVGVAALGALRLVQAGVEAVAVVIHPVVAAQVIRVALQTQPLIIANQ